MFLTFLCSGIVLLVVSVYLFVSCCGMCVVCFRVSVFLFPLVLVLLFGFCEALSFYYFCGLFCFVVILFFSRFSFSAALFLSLPVFCMSWRFCVVGLLIDFVHVFVLLS